MAATPGCPRPAEWSVLLTVSEHVATTHHRLWSSRSPNLERCPKVFDTRRAEQSRRGVPAGLLRPEPSVDLCTDAHDVASSLSLHCPVDGRSGDAEQVGEFSGAVLAASEKGHQVRFLAMVQLWLLATQTPFGLGDLHPLSGAQPDQVGPNRRPSRAH